MRFDRVLRSLPILALSLLPAAAQSIVSARAGVVNFSEGAVSIDSHPVDQKFGAFAEIKEGSELRTEKGRAEILLTPGVFLRLAEQSAIRMDRTMLADTRLEFLDGSATVEVAERPNGTSVIIGYHGYQLRFPSPGIFRIDSHPEEFRVLEGEAEVSSSGEKRLLTKGHMLSLAGGLVTETFTPALGDALYEWTMRRSDRMALANTQPDPADTLDSLGNITMPPLPDGSWVTSPFSGISTYVPSYDATLSSLGIGYASLYSPYGFYGGVYMPLSLRSLGSYYRAPPGHVNHGSYIYLPAPIYRSPVNTGFGRASHPAGAILPSGSAARAPATAPRAGHR